MFARLEQTLLEEARVQLDEGGLGQTGASLALVDRTVWNLRANDQQPPEVGFQLPAASLCHRFRVRGEQLAPRKRDGGDLYGIMTRVSVSQVVQFGHPGISIDAMVMENHCEFLVNEVELVHAD